MKISIVYNKNFHKYIDRLVAFYQPRYKEDYEKVIKNTSIICICEKDKEIIGIMRVLTDTKSAIIYDFVVRKIDRNKGIGTKLINRVIKALKEIGINKICLTTDPRNPWLVKYYEKLGFKNPKKEYYMVYGI